MVSKMTKKLIALIAVTSMLFVLLSPIAFAATLAQADGNAYFYFAASGLNVEAPDNFKVGFKANGSEPYYITENIIAHTERIDKNQLVPNAVNTFTIYTGDKNGLIDETLSRSEAGSGCEEFSITISTLNLTLPNGHIVYPSKKTAYKPKDNTTPLKDGYIASDVTSNVSMGDNGLNQAYKFEIEFDLTNVSWNPANDIAPILPDIKNVSLQIGANPSSRNIVWFSTSAKEGIVQLALKSDMPGAEFPENAKTFSATVHNSGSTGYKSYKATMTDLAENTEYVYRVGNEDGWSPAYSFKTQGFSGSFSFLAVSDPQLGQGNRFDNIQGEIDGWTDTLDKAKAAFPDAAFLASMGDQIAKTYSNSQFDAFFVPESLKSFAVAPVVGNHDVGSNYAPHFNMPNLSGYGIQTTMGPGSDDYWFTYGDALFMHINGISRAYDEHVKFMEETIEANPNAKWKFVMTHYGFYGATTQSYVTEDIIKLRETLAPEFSRLGIDVVLDGHEHCYSRSYLVNGFTETPNLSTGGSSVTDPDANEVLYLTFNSASGTDYVKPESMDKLPRTAKVVQEFIPNVSKIDMTDSSFTVNTYRTSDMAVVDSFTINRTDVPTVKSVSVSPKDASVKCGLSQAFEAKIFGYNNPSTDIIWTISGNESSKTTISQTGLLSVSSDETAKSVVVTATSATNSSKYASVNVELKSSLPLIYEDFESAPEGQIISKETNWNGWSIVDNSYVTEDTEITVVNEKYPPENIPTGNKVAQIYRSGASVSTSRLYSMSKAASVTQEDEFLSVKFRLLKPVNDNTKLFAIYLFSEKEENGKKTEATASFNIDFKLSKFSSAGLKTVYFDGGTSHATTGNKWFEFEILTDLTKDITYVYCNDILLTSGTAGAEDATKKIYGLKSIRFQSNRTSGAVDGEAYLWLDDICVRTLTANEANLIYSQPTVISKIENKTDVILRNRNALEDGTKLFVAVYDAKPSTMKSLSIVPLTAEQRAAGEQTITLPQALTADTGKVVKAFVLDSEFNPLGLALEKIQ